MTVGATQIAATKFTITAIIERIISRNRLRRPIRF
jgi:hypothetical protein